MTQLQPMMSTEIEGVRQRLHDYVVANFLFGADDLDDTASLLDEGVIDSMGVLELVLFLDEGLGVPVADDEVLPELFDSIDALAAFVCARLGLGADVAVTAP